jgi:hypothetical protein
MDERGIKISPNYYQKDWNELDLSKNSEVNWNKAIAIFEDRISGRYLKQIEALDNNKDLSIRTFSGFAIISLTCLLIETLEQFWKGNITTIKTAKRKSCFFDIFRKNRKNHISNDAKAFHSFFQRSNEFKVFFDTIEKSNIFYTQIRCGLLHQGQTKRKSLIHIRKNEPMLKWINDNNIEDGISIQRRYFVKEIIEIYNEFINKLKKTENMNFRRKTLVKKMKYIVDQK